MSTPVVINGQDFNIPTQGQNPPWGEDLSALLVAMVATINGLKGANDIILTPFTIANNTASVANVTGALFDTTQVRSAIISYSLYRSTSLSELSEAGNIYITYKSTAASWDISQHYGGSSGVVFSITNSGQLQYTSSNLSGTGYVGKMKFSASTFAQT